MATTPPKTRVEKREQTRRDLISATLDSIATKGFSETTLEKVSKRAGVSRGLVNFHFESKEKLLIEALGHMSEEYAASWNRALARADPNPLSQLVALIDSDFHPRVCTRKKVAIWYGFLGEARSRQAYTEVCQSRHQRFADALEKCCKDVADFGNYSDIDYKIVARGLGALIDSLWRDLMISPRLFSRENSKSMCFKYLANVFPRHFDETGALQP
jgi:TetR/AcrR family transcriptional repressor of bet genes